MRLGLQNRIDQLSLFFPNADGLSGPMSDADRRFRISLIRTTTLIMCAIGIPSFFLYWNLAVYSIAWGILATVSFSLVNVWLLQRTHTISLSAHLGVASLYLLLLCDNVVTGGFDRPNFAWLYVLPMVGAVMLDLRGAWMWLGITLATVLGFWLLPILGIPLESSLPAHLERGQALFSRVSAIVALGLVATAFVMINRHAKIDLVLANRELAHETKLVQLLQHAAVCANEATDLEDALEQSLERICSVMGWAGGKSYILASDGQLVPTVTVSDDSTVVIVDERLAPLSDSHSEFGSGEGLPGRAMASLRPEFLTDVSSAPSQRARDAERLGVQSAIAVPVMAENSVIAILEFGLTEKLEVDEHLRDVLSHVGTQIGRVAERVALQARVRQSQKIDAVGRLAAGMAHEINNPMSFVRSNISQLRREVEETNAMRSHDATQEQGLGDTSEWLELINDSLEGIERTIAIVGEVKECGETSEGGAQASELNQIVESARQQVSSRTDPPTQIHSDYCPDLPVINCLPQQLHRTFVNLIVNATQAAGSDGRIEIATGIDGSWVSVSIEDDGPGIAEDQRDRLFDPFYTTRPVGDGTGLGLYVACEIVATHGGEIRVHSEVGAGSRFEVRLPIESVA